MRYGALCLIFLFMPTSSYGIFGFWEEQKQSLKHFVKEEVLSSVYNEAVSFVQHLMTLSGDEFKKGCESLHSRLKNEKGRLLSDIFVTTIRDLIAEKDDTRLA